MVVHERLQDEMNNLGRLTSNDSGPDHGVASPMPFGAVPLLHLLNLNSVARSAARGVRRLKKSVPASLRELAKNAILGPRGRDAGTAGSAAKGTTRSTLMVATGSTF